MQTMRSGHYPSILELCRMFPFIALIRLTAILLTIFLNNIFLSFEKSLNIFPFNIIHLLQDKPTTHQSFSQVMVIIIPVLTKRVRFLFAFEAYLLQLGEMLENL